ncbi:sensor histidine kinase [Streptomyces sp. NPDC091280]|uniref:sensor histidine kinase n=1 Tax=Streptomyces sp. NPDC091280 TaxID=3365984 RepID=UPI00382C0E5A
MTEYSNRWRAGWRPRGADAGLVLLTLCAPLLMQSSADPSARAWWLLLATEVVTAVALPLRRKLPVTVFLVLLATLVAALVGGAAAGMKLSPLIFLSLAVALYNVGSYCTNWARTWLVVLGGGGAVVAAGVWINQLTAVSAQYRGSSDVIGVLAPMPLAWATGFAALTHRANLAAAERRMADVLREQQLHEQQAAQQERVRIAREMHDVVAHSLTLLVVQAETLRARGGELPAWARTRIDGLAVAGRQAGGELRDLLRVLRGPEDAAPLAPMPGLRDLPELLDRSRAAGAQVDGRIETDTGALPRPVQLTVYRIVQESLTNARRHSPGARVRVDIAEDTGQLRCEVVNSRPAEPVTASWGTGLGLVSMRERVDTLGGELHTGPTDDGGFQVLATLPLRTAPLDAAGV